MCSRVPILFLSAMVAIMAFESVSHGFDQKKYEADFQAVIKASSIGDFATASKQAIRLSNWVKAADDVEHPKVDSLKLMSESYSRLVELPKVKRVEVGRLLNRPQVMNPYRRFDDLNEPINELRRLATLMEPNSNGPCYLSLLRDHALLHLEYRNTPSGYDQGKLKTLMKDAERVLGPSDSLIGKIKIELGTCYLMARSLRESLDELQEAFEILKADGVTPEYLFAATRLGQLYLKGKNLPQSEKYLSGSLKTFKKKGIEPSQHVAAAVCVCAYGDVLARSGKIANASADYETSLADLQKFFANANNGQRHREVIRQYAEAGISTWFLGKTETSLAYYKFAYDHAKEFNDYPPLEIDNYALGIANNLRYLGRYGEIPPLLHKHPMSDDPGLAAAIANELGTALNRQEKYTEAIEVLKPYQEIRAGLDESTLTQHITSANTLVACYKATEKDQEALKLAESVAQEVRQFYPNSPSRYGAELSLARNYLAFGSYQQSLDAYKIALDLIEKKKAARGLELLSIYHDIGRCHLFLGDGAAAHKAFVSSKEYFDRHQRNNPGFGGAMHRDEWTPFPYLMLEPLERIHVTPNAADSVTAWQLLDQYRSPGLTFEIFAAEPKLLSTQDRSEKVELTKRLEAEAEKLSLLQASSTVSQSDIRNGQNRWSAMNARYASFQDKIRSRLATKMEPAELREVQAVLKPNDALIGFVGDWNLLREKEGKTRHWAFVLREDGPPIWVRLSGLGPNKEFTVQSFPMRRAFEKLISTDPRAGKPRHDWKRLQKLLHRVWFEPLEEHLDGVSHLFVMRSGISQQIPLAALTSDYSMTLVPSGKALVLLKQRTPVNSGHLFAMGASNGGVKLGGAKMELAQLAAKFASKTLLVDNDSTEANFYRSVSEGNFAKSEYIHFALHGVANRNQPLNAKLQMGEATDGLSVFDGQLSLRQMMFGPLQTRARLMVLSACETNRGGNTISDGETGFGSAALIAGSQNVISTRWPIDDFATSLIMDRFYDNLLGRNTRSRLSIADSLHEAQMWLRQLDAVPTEVLAQRGNRPVPVQFEGPGKKFDHPYYWAGFVHTGAN